MKKEQKKENQKKKKKRIDSDTAIVLIILFALIVIAVLFAFLSSGETSVETLDFSGQGNRPKKEQERDFGFLIGCGFLSVFIISLLVIKIVRDQRRKAKTRAIQMEKARKMKELQEARERVRKAKMNAFLNAGQEEIERRRQEERRLSNLAKKQSFHRNTYLDEDFSYLDEEADDDIESMEYEEEGFFARIAGFFRRLLGRN